jgi:mannose-6-phosphate isomerase-like protein (cupin superfamily)
MTLMGNDLELKLRADRSPRFAIVDYKVGPRFVAPPVLHHHVEDDWAGYVLEGTLTFVFSDRTEAAHAGDVIFVPRRTPFAWRNDADAPARFLAIYAPAGFERYFDDIAAALAGGATALTPEILAPLWARHGVANS